jgi:hypothetical protein
MKRFLVPRRRSSIGLIVVAIAAAVTVSAAGAVSHSRAASIQNAATIKNGAAASSSQGGEYSGPLCEEHPQLCTELSNPRGNYVSGHDEPSLLFYSNKAGSGNSNQYSLTLPTDPPTAPSQDGSGSTWNFQLHPAFWFGMALCDDQSAPNPGVPCKPDSNSNLKTSLDPNSPNYFGLTPGTAFMEMQFYPPGWGPVSCTDGEGTQDGKWCSALTIDSDPANLNTGVGNNPVCGAIVGGEPVNYAVITKSGVPVAPANPFTPFGEQAQVTADTLEYSNGDKLTVSMHDTKAGFQVVIKDLTTGQTGSMTASVANGFGHALFQPNATSCTFRPYAFHPMYSTSTPQTRVLWAAHSYNVAYSDEIGHFEYCNDVDEFGGDCTGYPNDTDSSNDDDDIGCFPYPVVDPSGNPISSLTGCLGSDDDFDGPEYQQGAWPGSSGGVTGVNVSTPIVFSSPLFGSGGPGGGGKANKNYAQAAFETDLPRIENATTPPCQRHVSNPSDPTPGAGCVNPPVGATFYPIFSTFSSGGACLWEEGGDNIAGATNNFGGNPAEYGGLLNSPYPAAGFTVTRRYNNFHNTLSNNPCPAATR